MLSKIARPWLALCILACAWGAFAAPPDAARIEEVMRKSGLWEQLGAMRDHVREGAASARGTVQPRGAKPLDDADFDKLLTLAAAAFSPERMRAWTSARLAKELTDEDVDAVLEFATSDLGKRFTRAEETVAAVDQKRMEDGAKAALAKASDARKALLRRLVAVLRAEEIAADLTINMSNAIVYGVAASAPGADAEGAIANAKKQAAARRPQLLAFFREFTYLQAAYAYRDIGDEDLTRYIAFNETPVAQRFNDATAKAVDYAVVQCSLQLGRSIASELGNKGRSA
jgi:hypothetical protein